MSIRMFLEDNDRDVHWSGLIPRWLSILCMFFFFLVSESWIDVKIFHRTSDCLVLNWERLILIYIQSNQLFLASDKLNYPQWSWTVIKSRGFYGLSSCEHKWTLEKFKGVGWSRSSLLWLKCMNVWLIWHFESKPSSNAYPNKAFIIFLKKKPDQWMFFKKQNYIPKLKRSKPNLFSLTLPTEHSQIPQRKPRVTVKGFFKLNGDVQNFPKGLIWGEIVASHQSLGLQLAFVLWSLANLLEMYCWWLFEMISL